MNDKLKDLAMLDVAEALLKENKEPMTINLLLEKVANIKDVDLEDADRLTQLYMDITQSAKFVYCGEDQWDLKERNLELWDKDGYAFVQADEIEEDTEEDLDFTEYQLEEQEAEVVEDEEDEAEVKKVKPEEKEEIKEEAEYIEVELPITSTDDDDEEELEIEFDDEDDYNEIMDDYEDMYDDE